MTGILPAVVKPELEGGNLVLVVVVALIALGALGMAAMFRSQVLAAGEGTDNMRTIAQAVQEGANAYLQRQFRTLGIFAAVAFVVLFALPAFARGPAMHATGTFDMSFDTTAPEDYAGDIVVTADIPLASRCVKAGARVIGTATSDAGAEAITAALSLG